MGDSELGQPISSKEEVGKTASFLSYFRQEEPYALAIGMTRFEYWEEDVEIIHVYVKANEIKQEQLNTNAYLQAMYYYDVLCRTAPMFNAFKPSKPVAFMDKPYDLKLSEEHNENKETMKKLKLMERTRAMFATKKKGGVKNE